MLFFVHGLGFDHREWDTVVHFFTQKDFDCNAINLREGLNLRSTCFQDYINKLKAVVTEEDIVIGHSMGGLVVQKVAEEATIKAGVGICPAPPKGIKFHMSALAFAPALKYLPKLLVNRPFKPDYPLVKGMCRKYMGVGLEEKDIRTIYEHMVEESPTVVREVALRKIAVDEKKIRCPLLFIAMTKDRACPPTMVEEIAQKYDAQYKLYDGCHHFFNNTNWQEIADGVYNFIKKL
jgi:pimeloyl-ACP methyl ester carboxylesterase